MRAYKYLRIWYTCMHICIYIIKLVAVATVRVWVGKQFKHTLLSEFLKSISDFILRDNAYIRKTKLCTNVHMYICQTKTLERCFY